MGMKTPREEWVRSRWRGVRTNLISLGKAGTRAKYADQRIAVDGFLLQQGLRQMVQRCLCIGQ
jgi:hypothetical protein